MVGDELLFNMNETKWKNINVYDTTIKIKGNKNLKIIPNGNHIESFSAVLTINAAGSFLKPIIIAKGTTNLCLKKFNCDNSIISTYSQNDWITKEILLISHYQKSIIVLDQYRVHTTNYIKLEATKRNIRLVYIPIEMTSTYQPLDVSINEPLKQLGKR